MSGAASNYNIARMNCGIAVAIISAFLTLRTVVEQSVQAKAVGLWIITITITYCLMMFASSYVEEEQHFWYWTSSAWLGWLLIKQYVASELFLCLLTDAPSRRATVISGSLRAVVASLSLLVMLRIVRAWNQTGQKHAGGADIARVFLPAHSYLLWILILATYVDVIRQITRNTMPWPSRWFPTAAAILLGVAALGFKVAFTHADAPELLADVIPFVLPPMKETSLVAQARAVFFGIGLMLFITVWPVAIQASSRVAVFNSVFLSGYVSKASANPSPSDFTQLLHYLLTLFLMTQSRATNIPLYLLFEAQWFALNHVYISSMEIILSSLLFQNGAFFAFGGSNAISSIDLSNAYNGVSGYNAITVGILAFLSNWAGPLWWTSATMLILSGKQCDGRQHLLRQYLSITTTFVCCSVLAVMLACITLRTHLFIWTVFSPKYLFSMAWSWGHHLCINIAFGSLMYWAGSSDLNRQQNFVI